jgi:hypothetical protein
LVDIYYGLLQTAIAVIGLLVVVHLVMWMWRI